MAVAVTSNTTQNTSQSLGDLAKGNIQGGRDVMNKTNSSLSDSLSYVANAYQSAYQEGSGILQQLKPVLMVGVVVLAVFLVPKLWKRI